MKHLRFDYNSAYDSGEARHAQVVMRELGITYRVATPQSMGDQWWFWNCANVPESLPPFITALNLDPLQQMGTGLSREDVEKITRDDES